MDLDLIVTYQCPSCQDAMQRREGAFHHRTIGAHHGYVCQRCNALYQDPMDPFIEAVEEESRC